MHKQSFLHFPGQWCKIVHRKKRARKFKNVFKNIRSFSVLKTLGQAYYKGCYIQLLPKVYATIRWAYAVE